MKFYIKNKTTPYKRRKKGDWIGLLFVAPSLVGVSVFVLFPFVDVFKRSFGESMSGKFTGLRNYQTVLDNDAFKLAAGNTFKFVLVCIPVLVVLSLLVGVIISNCSGKKFGDFFKTTFLLPMAVPVASVVLLWKVLFHKNGLINGFFLGSQLEAVDWMGTDWAFWVLVVSYLWKNLGYDMILWLAALSNINPSLYEAAKVDGADPLQCFFKITLPGIKPSLFIIAVLSLLNSFKVFREAYLIAGDYPHTSMYMLQHLFNNWFTKLEMDKMCAAAVLTAAVIFFLIMLLQKAWGKENN